MMNYDVADLDLVWRRGNGDMPEDLIHVVQAARNELLLRSLSLPANAVDVIRYNASKADKSINEYISALVLSGIEPA